MIYTIEDTPPWYLCVFLGLQVNLHMKLAQLLTSPATHVHYDVTLWNSCIVLYLSPGVQCCSTGFVLFVPQLEARHKNILFPDVIKLAVQRVTAVCLCPTPDICHASSLIVSES